MEKKEKKEVVGLSYDKNEKAPEIIAKGKGIVAEKILKKAKEEGIDIIENKEVIEKLNFFEIGELIPEELYEVVAEILVFVNKVDGDINE